MDCSWDSSELQLKFNKNVSDEVIKHMMQCSPTFEEESIENLRDHISNGNFFSVFPYMSNLFICDDQFIKSCKNPFKFFKYYEMKLKKEEKPCILNATGEIIEIQILDYSKSFNLVYKELLNNVILDMAILNKTSINVSPYIFSMLSNLSGIEQLYCKYISEFLSLLCIADRVIVLNNDMDYFEFQIFTKDRVKKIRHKWLDTSLNTEMWLTCYKWITSDGWKSIDINLKRQIVREVIAKYYNSNHLEKNIEFTEIELVRIFDNSLKLIIEGRTEEYFETFKVLKGEYVEIYSKNFESLSNIVNSILALIVALSAGMYGVFISQGEIPDLFAPNKSFGVFLLVILIAEVFVLFSAILKFQSHETYLGNLRKINTERLMISEEDQNYFDYSKSFLNKFIFIVLGIMIIATLIGIIWYLEICVGFLNIIKQIFW